MKRKNSPKINNTKNYILGVDRKKAVKTDDWIVHNIPEMDSIKIYSINILSKNENVRKVEIYYPPSYNFNNKHSK